MSLRDQREAMAAAIKRGAERSKPRDAKRRELSLPPLSPLLRRGKHRHPIGVVQVAADDFDKQLAPS